MTTAATNLWPPAHDRSRRVIAWRRLLEFAIVAVSILGFAGSAASAERLALLVGNQSYSTIARLENPVADARLMAEALANEGFTVTLLIDANLVSLNGAIAKFGRDLRAAGDDVTGLFFYAGHGVQSFGTNYLLPTDVLLTDAADLDLVAVPAESVLRQMASAHNRQNIVILDACRNNPFADIPDLRDNGLAEMKAPTGTFLSYSTAMGTFNRSMTDANRKLIAAEIARLLGVAVPIPNQLRAVSMAMAALNSRW